MWLTVFSLALPKEAIGNHAALREIYGYSCYCLLVLSWSKDFGLLRLTKYSIASYKEKGGGNKTLEKEYLKLFVTWNESGNCCYFYTYIYILKQLILNFNVHSFTLSKMDIFKLSETTETTYCMLFVYLFARWNVGLYSYIYFLVLGVCLVQIHLSTENVVSSSAQYGQQLNSFNGNLARRVSVTQPW